MALQTRADVTRSSRQGISGPIQKGLMSSKNLEKKIDMLFTRNFCFERFLLSIINVFNSMGVCCF